jgi:undecaprenyl-diphosphatase
LTLIEYIKQLDTQLFLFLNGLNHPFFDPVMSWISDKIIWIPFYGLLLYLIIKKHGVGSLKIIIPSAGVLILFSDMISFHLFKEMFQRYRPCHNLEIKHLVHLVDACGGMHGFISSHAANTFALAIFTGKILANKKALSLMVLWATVVSYSRIYLGVHYPLDIIGGALLGASIGYFISYWTNKFLAGFSRDLLVKP